jgi:hypothetical protein
MKPRVYEYHGVWVCQRGKSFTTWSTWSDAITDALKLIPSQDPLFRSRAILEEEMPWQKTRRATALATTTSG